MEKDFRGKNWRRIGNSYLLEGTKIRVYHWNNGKNQSFMVEDTAAGFYEQSRFTIPGKGQEAKENAIAKAYQLKNVKEVK